MKRSAYDLVFKGYPYSLVSANIMKSKNQQASNKDPQQKLNLQTEVLPYIEGLSETLRHCPQQHGIRSFFKSDTTVRSHLVRPKDSVHI